jgi:hypothetical protein
VPHARRIAAQREALRVQRELEEAAAAQAARERALAAAAALAERRRKDAELAQRCVVACESVCCVASTLCVAEDAKRLRWQHRHTPTNSTEQRQRLSADDKVRNVAAHVVIVCACVQSGKLLTSNVYK